VSLKRTDVSLSMREVEAPVSARSKRLMILITLDMIVHRLVKTHEGDLTPTPVRG
jgi:hypothetical protein